MPLCAAVYDTLQTHDEVEGISLLCCGRILSFEADGAPLREVNDAQMIDHFIRSSITRVVAACPNCARTLRELLETDPRTASVEVIALPRVLADLGYVIDGAAASELLFGDKNAPLVLYPHNSCPDRDRGEFAGGLWDLLPEGYRDPAHKSKRSMCCGSIMRAAGRHDEADRLARRHGEKARELGANAIVTACASCAFQLNSSQKNVPVVHFLELLYQWCVDWNNTAPWMKLRFLFDETTNEAQRLEEHRTRQFMGLGDGKGSDRENADNGEPAKIQG